MTYDASIPQPGDLISVSQGEILTNFTQLNTQFGGILPASGGDHDGFYNGSTNGTGMHNQVTFTANQAAPSLTRNGTSGVSGLYANLVSGVSQLFFQNATQNFQLTGGTNFVDTKGSTVVGGLLINWGQETVTNTGTLITFDTTYPTKCFGVVATTLSVLFATATVGNRTFPTSTTGFTAVVNVASVQIFYIAIGN